MQNICATRVPTAASYEHWLMVAVVGFHCGVISSELARQGVRRGAVEASGCGGVESRYAKHDLIKSDISWQQI